eukprot:3450541-Amphidinium_carterae.1
MLLFQHFLPLPKALARSDCKLRCKNSAQDAARELRDVSDMTFDSLSAVYLQRYVQHNTFAVSLPSKA